MIDALMKRLLSGQHSIESAQNFCAEILSLRIRTDHALHSAYFYEIRPIIKIAEIFAPDNKDIKLRFTSRTEEYDGEICVQGISNMVECTRADGNHNEALILEHLAKYGRAPAYPDIKATGTKIKREIHKQEPMFTETSSLVSRAQEQIISAFNHKQNEKYKDFWLAITFDDWIFPGRDKLLQLNALCTGAMHQVVDRNKIFARIFIVGNSMNYIWDSSSLDQEGVHNKR